MTPGCDNDGYLVTRSDWSEAWAQQLAKSAGTALNENHWAVIRAVQAYYERYDSSPNNRALVNHVRATLGEAIGNSTTLMQLFGGTPAKTAARWAGLPRPEHCL